MRSLLVLAAVAAAAPFLPATPPAYAAATCQGRPATIEASSGEVMGTPGPDVIVATGAVTSIDSGVGDDTVCVVANTVPIQVVTRQGDDSVDATAGGVDVEAYLGLGADSYLGGAEQDFVETTGHRGLDTIMTGAGRDDVVAVSPVAIDTGDDDDHVLLAGRRATSTVDMGGGEDTFETGGTAVSVDLVRGVVVITGTRSSLQGAEDVEAIAHRVRVVGDDGPNRIQVGSCQAEVTAGAGDDRVVEISHHVHVPGSCTRHLDRLEGGPGDDILRGSRGDDVLLGGPGQDVAYGQRGTDRCVAEKRLTCER